jgi:hypothetical protein
MSNNKELNLREAAAEGARLVKEGKLNANVIAVLKPLVHQAKRVLGYRDDQIAKAAAKRSKKAEKK